MGFFKDVLGDVPLEIWAYCPVCDKYTNQTQLGSFGYCHQQTCNRCNSVWKKDANKNWVRVK